MTSLTLPLMIFWPNFAPTAVIPSVLRPNSERVSKSTMLKARKSRLASARAGLAASQALPRHALGGMENARTKLARVLAACSPEVKLTLAARNERELSDADVLGMLEDLVELGIIGPDDDQGRA